LREPELRWTGNTGAQGQYPDGIREGAGRTPYLRQQVHRRRGWQE
jgi:hypothetical protein